MTSLQLPHAYPFLLIDRVRLIEPPFAVAVRQIAADDPLLAEDGFLPPALLLEAIAQCAGIAVAAADADAEEDVARGGMLVSFDRFRVAGRVAAGDSLEIRARVVRKFGALVRARGRVRANGRLRACAELVLRVQP